VPCPAFGGIGGVKGYNIKEISFPGSPALCAESFTNKSLHLKPNTADLLSPGGEGRVRGRRGFRTKHSKLHTLCTVR